MDEHGVLPEVEHEDEKPTTPVRGIWAALGALAVVAVTIIFSTRPAADVTPTTFPPVPSVSVPPTLPDGVVVDQTLRWTAPTGLDEVRQVGGLAEYDGRYWLIGTDGSGITAWTSPKGDVWSEEAPVTADGDWNVDSVYADEDGLVVSASGWVSGSWSAALFRTTDGSRWDSYAIPEGKEGRTALRITELRRLADDFVAHGWVGSPPVVEHLPEPYRSLVQEGAAWAEEWPSSVRVWLSPGVVVAEIPASELPEYELVRAPNERQVWTGASLDALTPQDQEAYPRDVVGVGSGAYAGVVDGSLLHSDNGVDWEPLDVAAGVNQIAAWQGGIAVTRWDRPPEWWVPDNSPQGLLPSDLGNFSYATAGLATGDAVGLSIAAWRPSAPIPPDWDQIRLDERTFDVEFDLGSVVLFEDGREVWRAGSQSSAAIMGEGLILESDQSPPITIPLRRWVQATSSDTSERPSGELTLLHTRDGNLWSETSWQEMTGQATVARVRLEATDHFFLAIGSGMPDGDEGVVIAVGRPFE